MVDSAFISFFFHFFKGAATFLSPLLLKEKEGGDLRVGPSWI